MSQGKERCSLSFLFPVPLQQLELEKSRSKLTKVTEEAETERKEEVGRKEAEIQQLKQKLESQTEEVNKQQVQTQAHKEYLDKITLELEAMKVRTVVLFSVAVETFPPPLSVFFVLFFETASDETSFFFFICERTLDQSLPRF